MSVYLVRAEHKNGFINIRPVMELLEDGFIEADEEKFGQYGTITIGAASQYSDNPFLQDRRYSVFNIDDSELTSLEQTYSGYKIRAADFLSKTKYVDGTSIREVIYLPETLKNNNFSTWGREYISNIMPPISKTVYLVDSQYVAGPFSWKDSGDGQYLFSPKPLGIDPYMIDCFRIDDFDTIYTFEAGKYPDLYSGRDRHIINIDTLPSKIFSIDCIDDEGLKDIVGRMISQSAETRKQQREIREAVNSLSEEELSNTRRNRIIELARNGELAEQTINNLPSLILENDEQKTKIAEIILSNENFLQKLYPVVRNQEGFQSLFQKLEEDKTRKESELQLLEQRIATAKSTSSSEIEINSDELNKLTKEKEELLEQLKNYQEIDNIQTKYLELQSDYVKTQNQYNAVLTMKNSLEEDISQKIKSAYTSFAFDGALSSLMLQEAAIFERQQSQKNIAAEVMSVDKVPNSSSILTPQELVDYLFNELTNKAHRMISKNDISNLILCLSQGFLTVLAGEPGTGKTSTVSLLATILGLSNASSPRYAEVAVEKGWTSRRDLVGYYNPLTKSFDAASKGVYSALSVLNAEAIKGIDDFPFWILLDEANLSQMEHYWADFMSLCDFDKANRKISLSENYEFLVPSTLRFLATINLDHTTEVLSPRLIDRAWIIMLNNADMDIEDYEEPNVDETYPLITNRVFSILNTPDSWKSKSLDESIVSKFQDIQKIFRMVNVNFSPRLIGMIKKYCLASKGLLDDSDNIYTALDYAIAQKVLPMINGYGESYGSFVNALVNECDLNTMPKSNQLLLSISEKAKNNMQYYQFFAR